MMVFTYLKKSIAVGQKTEESPRFGSGFNYDVEAGFQLSADFDLEKARVAFEEALNTLDHRALNVDVDLGFEPTSARLCLYLFEQLRARQPGVSVTLKMARGDGAIFNCNC